MADATVTATVPTWDAPATAWSDNAQFLASDLTLATAWVASAAAFTCIKAAGSVATTDCNALLGLPTGACCYTVTSTPTTKTAAATGFNLTVTTAILGVLPTATAANICSSPTML